jgi:hypothetical protein
MRQDVAGEIIDLAVGGGNASVVQHRPAPVRAACVRSLVNRKLEALAAEAARLS